MFPAFRGRIEGFEVDCHVYPSGHDAPSMQWLIRGTSRTPTTVIRVFNVFHHNSFFERLFDCMSGSIYRLRTGQNPTLVAAR